MNQLQSLLSKIIHNEGDFCCLCFSTANDDGFISFADQVVLFENSDKCNVKISEILTYVFGESDATEMLAFSSICQQCSSAVINGYRFLRECRENMRCLTTAVQHLATDLEHVSEEPQGCRNLFIKFQPADNSSYLIYDSISPLSDAQSALERFRVLTNPVKSPKIKDAKEIKAKLVLNSTLTNLNLFQCKECEKVYPSATSLRNHSIKAHEDKTDSSLVCLECGKTCKNRYRLAAHEKSHYVRIICPDCGRLYKNNNTFKKHLENNICQTKTRHSQAEAKYTCDYCQKKYTQKITLRVHIQYEHLNYKYHNCKWCDKKFWCRSRLNAHIVKHTKERNHVCSICGGKFVTKESLLYHTRIHTGERPYPCPQCDSRFLSASRRSAHVRTHHMDPTVECDVCHAKFRSNYYLRKHKRIHDVSVTETTNDNKHLALATKVVKKVVYPSAKSHADMSSDDVEKLKTGEEDSNQNPEPNDSNDDTRLYYDESNEEDGSQITSQAAEEQTEVIETEVMATEGTVEECTYQIAEGEVIQTAVDGKQFYVEVMEGENKYYIKVANHVEV